MLDKQDIEDDGFELVDGDVTDAEIDRAAAAAQPRALMVVDNLDDGDTIRLWARFDVKIRRVINRVYKRFDLERQDGDRLVRADDGEDVFAHEQESVKEYIVRHGGKARIRWQYSGPTGGAGR